MTLFCISGNRTKMGGALQAPFHSSEHNLIEVDSDMLPNKVD